MTDGIEVVGQTEPFENVLDFASRGQRAWSPPPPPPKSPRDVIVEQEPDMDAIERLSALLEDFENGKHHGLVLLAGTFDPKGNLTNYRMILSEVAMAYPISFAGALANMKLEVAEASVGHLAEGAIPEINGYDDAEEQRLHEEEDLLDDPD